MRKAHIFFVFALSLVGLVAAPAGAEPRLPAKSVIVTRDMDFPGGDLASLFDTTLKACESACLGRADCAAYTYNTRSSACFLKSAVTQRSPYEGAVSAVVTTASPAAIERAETQATRLDFLAETDFAAASRQTSALPHDYVSGAWTPGALTTWAHEAERDGNLLSAMRYTAAATVHTDAAADWTDYARLANGAAAATSDKGDKRKFYQTGLEAAINGFLRATSGAIEANALIEMATALENLERGRASIPALRMAQVAQPRDDTRAAIDRAVGKYGFRVTDTTVDNDAATPRICATFSEPLIKAGTDYAPFVQSDTSGLAVEASGQQLCVSGVSHGARYALTLRAGLPAASGEALSKPVQLSLYVRDRAPSVHFPGRAYVLPASPDAGLPIVAVNAAELDLTLSRLSDRNLVRAFQDRYFGRRLDVYEMSYFNETMAEEIWTGSATVETDLNRDVTTRLPIGDALAGQPPGVYVLSARVPGTDPYDVPPATQWFVVSDIGVTSLMGSDGLHVFARALGSAEPLAGASVELISRANAVLGTATTDATGYALFATGQTTGQGAAAPAMLVLRNTLDTGPDAGPDAGPDLNQDIAFLSLTDPAFDLSDRGVEGRPAAPPIDLFLTTDRGAYRAGEVIHATALARDATASAIDALPVTAVLSRPDGVEYARDLSSGAGAGGHVFALPVDATAPRGTWRLDLFTDPDAPALASTTLLVEDFLPERIDFDMSFAGPLAPGASAPLDLAARYLFGAPGADLAITGDLRLRPAASVDGFPGYRFGLYDDPASTVWGSVPSQRTDAQGNSRLTLTLPDADKPGVPMEAHATLRVTEGSGRPVERSLTAPVAPDGAMIGIKPGFDGELPEGAEARFSLIALAPDLTPTPMQVAWEINRVETRYQWYSTDGNWNWDPVTTRARVASGTAALGAAPVTVGAPTEWGRYEIVVSAGEISSSLDFEAGWYAAADATTTPDMLEVSLDATAYKPGDTATLRFVPRTPGKALITVVSNRLIDMKAVDAVAGENTLTLPVTDDWGAGAYVTATLIQPLDSLEGRNPTRALGLTHASVDPGAHQLTASIEVAAEARPRGPLEVSVNVDGITDGEAGFVTLAAVDVGILNLTSFDAPDPSDHYFGQRRLGVGFRDIYGRLIDGRSGAMGAIRSGGDAMAMMRMQAPPPTEELMAQFFGPLEVVDGKATATLDLPAFNGTVRLMAVAWSPTGVGNAATDVLVRDPIVVTASLPRFLSPGDEGRLLLELTHATGPTGSVRLSAGSADGRVAVAGSSFASDYDLGEGATQRISLPVTASALGNHPVTVVLTTPDGIELTKTLTLPVQRLDPEISETSRFTLAAGQDFTLTSDLFAGLASGRANVTAGPLARIDVAGLIDMLDRYPYGCTEQTTSRALPLLYMSGLAEAMGLGDRDDLPDRITKAVTAVLANQSSSGSFGVWRPGSGDLWLDAFASDFLSRARAQGYAMPDTAFRSAMDNLRNRVNSAPDFDSGGEALAYALYVLAREGAAAMGDLRYYADIKGTAFATPLASAQLGAALAAYGDPTRADRMFARAAQQVAASAPETQTWRADYGTNLRDSAAVLTLAIEAGSAAIDRAAFLSRLARDDGAVSTQEATWSLLAANAYLADAPGGGLSLDGTALTGPLVQSLTPVSLSAPRVITNTSDEDTLVTVTTIGVPDVPRPPSGNGYDIARRYFTLDGAPADPGTVAHGTRLVAVLTVTPWAKTEGRLMVTDPLPAGFEIDNPNLIRAGDIKALDWLEVTTNTETTEFRQDRFLAAVNWKSDTAFRLAYLVRAVTPGRFHHPAASVEDMYRPAYRAVGETGAVVVTE